MHKLAAWQGVLGLHNCKVTDRYHLQSCTDLLHLLSIVFSLPADGREMP